jgi:hypothetical protein
MILREYGEFGFVTISSKDPEHPKNKIISTINKFFNGETDLSKILAACEAITNEENPQNIQEISLHMRKKPALL